MKATAGLVAVLDLSLASPADAAGDAAKGQTLFKARCSTFHNDVADPVRKTGPLLAGVARRKGGGDPNFTYSKALKGAKFTWTPAQLDAFLAAPAKAVPGTNMMIGVPNAQDRADIVAYVSTLKK